MLSQLERLSRETDGRYASDAELSFAIDYVRSFNLRLQTYQKLQEMESTLLQQTYAKMRAIDPDLFTVAGADMTSKWKRDTVSNLRYIATAVLMDDPDTYRERMLLWTETVLRSFAVQRSCNVTYQVLQELVKQYLTAPQANLVCPLLEMSRRSLGAVA